jgi:hypothetical protein
MPQTGETRHTRTPLRSLLAVFWWDFVLLAGRLPGGCRAGLHDWCGCCSPMTCLRCGRLDPWS